MSQRQILRTRSGSRQQIRALLESLFTAELLSPSPRLFLVSPWIRDIELLDNRSGGFRGLEPSWGRRQLRLGEVLTTLVQRGSHLTLATRPEPENKDFVRRVNAPLSEADRARFVVRYPERLHAKGLVGRGYAITGSMNFTNNGVENLDEFLRYETDPQRVAELLTEFSAEYGGVA
ncbi:MAG: phosphatidylserine/phosphatidylglycerophosphate/cardiolipin synthase family protein [Alphaproteobacteria bacterium]|nr:phosphatidylserine/phosphatidylglycerophosphate/cardiolipin synthase family protein [Alphaproteobacteria bacterium]